MNTKNKKIGFDIDLSESTWLSCEQICILFGMSRTVIVKHINNIIKSEKINESINIQKRFVEDSDKPIKFYSLDIVLLIGYKVNTIRGVEFRKWASDILKDYIKRDK